MNRTTHINDALRLARLLEPSWPAISARIAASGAPTCQVADAGLREKLRRIESELSDAREQRVPLQATLDKAKREFTTSPDSAPTSAIVQRGARAADELRAHDDYINELQQAQIAVLKIMGRDGRVGRDQNGPRLGDGPAGGDGWDLAARELSLQDGRLRVDMPARDLLAADFNVAPGEGLTTPAVPAPFMQRAMDHRGLYGVFPRQQVEEGDLAITEYRQTGSRKLTGNIERDPVNTVTEKAALELSIELATPSLVQWAVIQDGVPSKLLESIPAMRAFLESELKYQVELGVDAHCISQLEAAGLPTGKSGATLIEQVRNAVAAMRALGATPTVLAVSPADAATLDLMKTGAEGMETYLFTSKATGSASPLWGLTVVEVPSLTAPMLIDPQLAAVLYTATGTVLLDPYTGLDVNTVRLRVEIDGLLHVRDISGAYLIA